MSNSSVTSGAVAHQRHRRTNSIEIAEGAARRAAVDVLMLVVITALMSRYSPGKLGRGSHAEILQKSRGMSGLRQWQDTILSCSVLYIFRYVIVIR